MKRILSAALAALTIFSAAAAAPVSTQAFAAAPASVASVYSSDYLSSYNGFATKAAPGEMDITFKVVSPMRSDELGASKIEIYKASGSKVQTVYGSTSNDLTAEDISMHTGSYTFYGTAGTTYYAKFTVFASRGGGSESRTITTNSVTL